MTNIPQYLVWNLMAWAVLTVIVVFLAIYRKKLVGSSDENIHVLDSEAQEIPTQAVVAKKLTVVDRWGKTLTVLAVLYLLGIAGVYIYNSFQDTSIKLG